MNDNVTIYWFDENFYAHEDVGIVRSNGTAYLVKKYKTIEEGCYSTSGYYFSIKLRAAIKAEINKRENQLSDLKDNYHKIKDEIKEHEKYIKSVRVTS